MAIEKHGQITGDLRRACVFIKIHKYIASSPLVRSLNHLLPSSSQKQNIVIPEVTLKANSSHSPLFLGREHGKGYIYKLQNFIENQ